MNKKVVTIVFVALFALSAFILIPPISSTPPRTIRIGVIASSTAGMETLVPLFEKIIEPDINEYLRKLPKQSPPLRIDFLIEDAQTSRDIHLEKVQEFHAMGTDLIIGGFWSSQAYYSLDYVNDNDMLLISPSSTAQTLAIPDDNLFRLCPDDTIQGSLLARMISSRGIENVVVLQRDDTWGNGLFNVFMAEYGGNILGRFVYPGDKWDNFHSYLADANAAASSVENVGVLLISLGEVTQIIIEASDGMYPNIYGQLGPEPRDPPWFGTEASGRSQDILDWAPDQAVHLTILSALPAPPNTAKFNDLNERYQRHAHQEAWFYTATQVDCAWILTQAVLETQLSTSGTDIAKVLPDIASRHYGYSGWCLLNDAGDRESSNFDIWGFYRQADGTPAFKRYGLYDASTDELTWYDW
jgi:branched-chain amino acid transport system substrate-binding protein